METFHFVLSCFSFIINLLAAISSIYALIFLTKYVWQQHDINILLVLNTYIVVSIWSSIQTSLNINAILGDQQWYIYVDSLACQVRGYIYLNMVPWLFITFILQAYIRMLNIISPQEAQRQSFKKILAVVMICYVISFLIMTPTFIYFHTIVYMPNEYQCATDLNKWEGNIYMILVFYSVPIEIIVVIYIRVLQHVRKSSIRIRQERKRSAERELRILQRILILIGVLVILGFPSSVLWLESLFRGRMHPITYRIQAFFLGISIFLVAWAVALINPQVKRVLPLLNRQTTTAHVTVYPQQQIRTISHEP